MDKEEVISALEVRVNQLTPKYQHMLDLEKKVFRLEQENKWLHSELIRLKNLGAKLHGAKGRYHTQIAACDLFDALGLKNERPTK